MPWRLARHCPRGRVAVAGRPCSILVLAIDPGSEDGQRARTKSHRASAPQQSGEHPAWRDDESRDLRPARRPMCRQGRDSGRCIAGQLHRRCQLVDGRYRVRERSPPTQRRQTSLEKPVKSARIPGASVRQQLLREVQRATPPGAGRSSASLRMWGPDDIPRTGARGPGRDRRGRSGRVYVSPGAGVMHIAEGLPVSIRRLHLHGLADARAATRERED